MRACAVVGHLCHVDALSACPGSDQLKVFKGRHEIAEGSIQSGSSDNNTVQNTHQSLFSAHDTRRITPNYITKRCPRMLQGLWPLNQHMFMLTFSFNKVGTVLLSNRNIYIEYI